MSITYEAIKFILFAACLLVVFRGVNKFLRLVYFKKPRLKEASRIVLFLELAAWTLLFLRTANVLLENKIPYVPALIAFAALILLAASWFAVRDWAAGLIIKMENSFEEGDVLAFDEVEGRVKRMGYRYVLLENDKTGNIILPYSLIAGKWILKSKTTARSEGYKFNLKIDKEAPMPETLRLLRDSALNSPWSLAAKVPVLSRAGEDDSGQLLEVVVYPAASNCGHYIERRLKQHKYVIN